MHVVAFIAGFLFYLLFAVPFGLMALGVGFMQEPERTIYGHVIVLLPFVPAGVLTGYLARSRHLLVASCVALAALCVFLARAHGPIPFLVREGDERTWVFMLHLIYQASLYLLVCVSAAWVGGKLRKNPVRQMEAN